MEKALVAYAAAITLEEWPITAQGTKPKLLGSLTSAS